MSFASDIDGGIVNGKAYIRLHTSEWSANMRKNCLLLWTDVESGRVTGVSRVIRRNLIMLIVFV